MQLACPCYSKVAGWDGNSPSSRAVEDKACSWSCLPGFPGTLSASCVSLDETRDFQQSVQPNYGVERSFPIHDLVATVVTRLYTAGSCESNLLSRKVTGSQWPKALGGVYYLTAKMSSRRGCYCCLSWGGDETQSEYLPWFIGITSLF